MSKNLTVIVDENLCASTLLCFEVAAGAFRLTEDGYAQVDDPSAVTDDQLREAARRCPTGAIVVLEVSTDDARD